MTEISFLIDLLTTEKLSKTVRDKINARVKEVEAERLTAPIPTIRLNPQPITQGHVVNGAVQSPSTLAAMARQGQLPPPADMPAIGTPPPDAPMPVPGVPQAPGNVVASPAAATAMANRRAALTEAITGKPTEKGQTQPRKW